MRRATPMPRADGAVQTRLISPVALSTRLSPPHPIASPSSRAITKRPDGGVISSTSGWSPVQASKPPSKRAASSRKYVPRQRRASAVSGDSAATLTEAARISRSTSPIAASKRVCSEAFEGVEHRLREIVRESVVGRAFCGPFARQARMTAATVVLSLRHSNQPLPLQGLQQATDIARIEPEPAAERADIGAIGADFENEPRLRQRAAPSQVIRPRARRHVGSQDD